MRFLICDDDPMNLLLHKTVIRRLSPDAEIQTANNGKDGLWKVKLSSFRYDIIITDYNMPQMNGGEMVREIRKIQPSIIAICITSDSTYKHEDEFDYSLQKPVVKNDIKGIMEEIRTNLIKLLLKRRNENNNTSKE